MNKIQITPYKRKSILLFALVLFCIKANAQVMPFGLLHSNVPTITNVVAGDGQVAVTFDHPEANGGTTSTVYTVTSSPGEITATGTSSPITIAELTNGTAYTFTVTATNSAGTSPASAASNAVTPIPILVYGEVYNPTTNKVWKDRNLGATQVAINSTDTDSYGDLFQWGRGADDHEKRDSGITTGPSTSTSPGSDFLTASSNWYSGTNPDDLWKEDGTVVNDPCPSGFRLPTDTEWENERLSWIYTNVPGDFTSPLKLPRSGYREKDDGLPAGPNGYYWSSTISVSKSIAVSFNSGASNQGPFDRAFGFSVRCIKEVTAPDAPTSVEATGGDTAATVAFTAPASNGGATITGYTVTSSPGGISANGLSSPISITGLTNGTSYTFNVTATNSDGFTSESAASNEVTLAVPQIGDFRDGGVVFYVAPTPTDLNGDGILNIGLIAADSNQGTVQWGCQGTGISGADGTAIGTGNQNTIDIIAGCSTAGIAARLCDALSLNGYNDWFLPSKEELNLMYENIGRGNALGLGNIGNFDSSFYWSSSEFNNDYCSAQEFSVGTQGNFNKSNTTKVRAVRAF